MSKAPSLLELATADLLEFEGVKNRYQTSSSSSSSSLDLLPPSTPREMALRQRMVRRNDLGMGFAYATTPSKHFQTEKEINNVEDEFVTQSRSFISRSQGATPLSSPGRSFVNLHQQQQSLSASMIGLDVSTSSTTFAPLYAAPSTPLYPAPDSLPIKSLVEAAVRAEKKRMQEASSILVREIGSLAVSYTRASLSTLEDQSLSSSSSSSSSINSSTIPKPDVQVIALNLGLTESGLKQLRKIISGIDSAIEDARRIKSQKLSEVASNAFSQAEGKMKAQLSSLEIENINLRSRLEEITNARETDARTLLLSRDSADASIQEMQMWKETVQQVSRETEALKHEVNILRRELEDAKGFEQEVVRLRRELESAATQSMGSFTSETYSESQFLKAKIQESEETISNLRSVIDELSSNTPSKNEAEDIERRLSDFQRMLEGELSSVRAECELMLSEQAADLNEKHKKEELRWKLKLESVEAALFEEKNKANNISFSSNTNTVTSTFAAPYISAVESSWGTDVAALSNELADARKQLRTSETALAQARAQGEAAEAARRLEHTNATISGHVAHSEREAMYTRISAIEKHWQTLLETEQNEHASFAREARRECLALEGVIADLRNDHRDSEARFEESLQQSHRLVENVRAEAKANSSRLADELRALRGELSQTDAALASKDVECSSSREECSRLSLKVSALREENNRLSTQLESALSTAQSLREMAISRSSTHEKETTNLRTSYESRVKSLEESLQKSSQRITTLEDMLKKSLETTEAIMDRSERLVIGNLDQSQSGINNGGLNTSSVGLAIAASNNVLAVSAIGPGGGGGVDVSDLSISAKRQLVASHSAMLESITSQHKRRIEAMTEQHTSELRAQHADFERVLAIRESAAADRSHQASSQRILALEEVIRTLELRVKAGDEATHHLQRLQRELTAISEQRSSSQRDLDSLQSELAASQAHLKARIATLETSERQARKSEAAARAETAAASTLAAEERRDLIKAHASETEAIRIAHEKSLQISREDLTNSLQRQLRDAREMYEAELRILKDAHSRALSEAGSESDSLRSQISSLKHTIETTILEKESEREALRAEVDAAKRSIETNATLARGQLESETHKLRAKARADIETLEKSQQDELKRVRETFTSKQTEWIEERSELFEKLHLSLQDCMKLRSEIERISPRISELEEELQKAKDTISLSAGRASRTTASLEEELRDTVTELTEAKKFNDKLKLDLDSLRSRLESSARDAADAMVRMRDEANRSTESLREAHQRELKLRAEHTSQIGSELQNERDRHAQSNREFEASIASLKEEIARKDRVLERAENEINAAQKSTASLRDEGEGVMKLLSIARDKERSLSVRLAEHEVSAEEAQKRIAEAEATILTMKPEITSIRAQLAQSLRDIEIKGRELTESKRRAETLSTELFATSDALSRSRLEISEATAEVERLKKEAIQTRQEHEAEQRRSLRALEAQQASRLREQESLHEQAISDREADVARLRREHEAEIAKIKASHEKEREEIKASVSLQASSVTSQRESQISSKLAALEGELKRAEAAKIDLIETHNSQINTIRVEARAELAAARIQSERWRSQASELEDSLTRQAQELENARMEAEKIRSEGEAASIRNRAELDAALTRAQVESSTIKAAAEANAARLEGLYEEALAEASKAERDAVEAREIIKQQLVISKEELEDAKKTVSRLSGDLVRLKAEGRKDENEADTWRDEATRLEEELRAEKRDNQSRATEAVRATAEALSQAQLEAGARLSAIESKHAVQLREMSSRMAATEAALSKAQAASADSDTRNRQLQSQLVEATSRVNVLQGQVLEIQGGAQAAISEAFKKGESSAIDMTAKMLMQSRQEEEERRQAHEAELSRLQDVHGNELSRLQSAHGNAMNALLETTSATVTAAATAANASVSLARSSANSSFDEGFATAQRESDRSISTSAPVYIVNGNGMKSGSSVRVVTENERPNYRNESMMTEIETQTDAQFEAQTEAQTEAQADAELEALRKQAARILLAEAEEIVNAAQSKQSSLSQSKQSSSSVLRSSQNNFATTTTRSTARFVPAPAPLPPQQPLQPQSQSHSTLHEDEKASQAVAMIMAARLIGAAEARGQSSGLQQPILGSSPTSIFSESGERSRAQRDAEWYAAGIVDGEAVFAAKSSSSTSSSVPMMSGLSSTLGSSTAGFYSIAHPPPPAPPQQPSSSRLRPISSSPTFMRVGVSHSPVVGLVEEPQLPPPPSLSGSSSFSGRKSYFTSTTEGRSPIPTHNDLYRRSPPQAMSNSFVGSYIVNSSAPAPRLSPPGKESSSSVRPVHPRRTTVPSVITSERVGRLAQPNDISFSSTSSGLSMSDLSTHQQHYVVNAPVFISGSTVRPTTSDPRRMEDIPGVQQAAIASSSAKRSVRNF
jgi:chromosome segregation ATPase